MKLVIREYLSLLKEDGELDVLIPELLLNMGYTPISKAQKGVRQSGVDVAAAGKDTNGRDCLLLFVIKQGNITRTKWNEENTGVRSTLDEIFDVYLQNRILPAHKYFLKVIILCTNGDLNQAVEPNWTGYVDKCTKSGEVEFKFWGGDELALRIEEYMLSEHVFPEESRSDFRKALALIAEPEYELDHFYRLLKRTLSHVTENETESSKQKRIIRSLRIVNLFIMVIHKWALSENNLHNALIASERTILWCWDFIQKENVVVEFAISEYAKILASRVRIQSVHFRRLQEHYHTRDAMSIGLGESIFITERAFEQIGFISLAGLHVFLFNNDEEAIEAISDALTSLISNNECSLTPCYDEHAIEISLALIFLFYTGGKEFAKGWVSNLCKHLNIAYKFDQFYPIGTDSFDDVVELQFNSWSGRVSKKAKSMSTLIPILAQWCCVLNLDSDYALLVELQNNISPQTACQMWYPDKDTEQHIYLEPAHSESGASQVPIDLPDSMDAMRQQVKELVDLEWIPNITEFSSTKVVTPILVFTAFRHFRTPVFPQFWQELMLPSQTAEVENTDYK